MSLKEWKNNELNQLLLKKFGILKEEKKPDADGDGVPDWADKNKGKDDNAEKEEMEEGRMNPRTTNPDKFVGHEDRYQPDRIHEEEEAEEEEVMKEEECLDEACGDKKYMKEEKIQNLKESIKRIAKANKIILKSINKRIK